MKKKIIILGSTGSIGLNTLKIVEKNKNLFNISLLSANKNYSLICNQIKKYNPEYFIIKNEKILKRIKERFKKKRIKFLNNFNNLKFKKKVDITVSAIPGIDGLGPTIMMTKLSKKLLIANKEAVICGWNLIKKSSLRYKTQIIPVDSEHFSISRLIKNFDLKKIKKIYITASGGPFLNLKYNKFKKIKPKDALRHPKWKMGKKSQLTSATLMNKVLELIEAQKIFDIPSNKIGIIIHPESLVHAIIKLENGLSYFIYHETSMIIPLVNAIFDENLKINKILSEKKTNQSQLLKNLSFQKVNYKTFPSIKLIKKISEYPSTPIIINASNEILVDQFLRQNIPFLKIYKIIMTILNDRNYKKYAIRRPKNIKQILTIDNWARKLTLKKCQIKKKYY